MARASFPVVVSSLLFGVSLAGSQAGAQPCGPWQWADPLPQGDHLVAVASGGGRRVAVGPTAGIVAATGDGPWVHVLPNPKVRLQDVTFGVATFVAVGDAGTVLTSEDGTAWEPRTSGVSEDLWAVRFDGSRFVAFGRMDGVLTSSDGRSWGLQTSSTAAGLGAVAWTGSTFVAVNSAHLVIASRDGVTWWSVGKLDDWYSVHAMAYGAGRLVAVGWNLRTPRFPTGIVLTSTDGVTWRQAAQGGYWISGVVWTGSQFVAVGGPDVILASPDGEHWQSVWSPLDRWLASRFYAVGWDGIRLTAVGGGGAIVASDDGAHWREESLRATDAQLRDVCWTGSQFVVVGGTGMYDSIAVVATSPDGAHWSAHDSPDVLWGLRRVVSSNGSLVGVDGRGDLLTSKDGQTWGPTVVEPGLAVLDVAAGAGRLVILGSSGSGVATKVLTSADGLLWQTSFVSPDLITVRWTGSQFVAVGPTTMTATSPDGLSWTSWPQAFSGSLRFLAAADGVAVAGGDGGLIVRSDDGVHWTTGQLPTTAAPTVMATSTGFIAVGQGVYGSEDGISWHAEEGISTENSIWASASSPSATVLVGDWGTVLRTDCPRRPRRHLTPQ